MRHPRAVQRYAAGGGTGWGDRTPAQVQAFVQKYGPTALKYQQLTGIPASVFLAIAGSESNFGNTPGFALFGMTGSGTAGSVTLGQTEAGTIRLRAYNSADEAFRDFATLIQKTPRYAQAWANRANPDAFIQGLVAGGYVGDTPNDRKWPQTIASIRTGVIEPNMGTVRDYAVRYLPNQPAAPQQQQGSGYAFPMQGYVGKIEQHWGSERGASDVMAASGTPVVAMRGGTVTSVGSAANGNAGGNNVTIQGSDGLQYYYAHLRDAALVRPGQQVQAGTPLGLVGQTGNAANTPPHLHIGIGKTIASGVGPQGGAGVGFDAVGLLTKVLAEGSGGGTTMAEQPAYPTPQNQQQVADLGRQTPATSSRDARLESFADTRVAELMNKIDELDKRVAELTAVSSKPLTDDAAKAAVNAAVIELGQLGTTRDNYVNEIKTLYPYTKGAAARVDSPAQQTQANASLINAQAVADKLGIDLAQWEAEFPLKAQQTANQTFGVQTDRLNAITAMDGNTIKALGEAFGEQSEVMKGYLTLFQLNQTRTNDWVQNQIAKGQMDLNGLNTYVAARDHQQAGEIARAVEELNRAKYISDERHWLAQHTLASNQQPYLDPGAYMQGKLKEAGIAAPTIQMATPVSREQLDPIKVLSEAKGTLPAAHDDAWWGIPEIQASRQRAQAIDIGERPRAITPADVKMPQPYSLEQIQGALAAGSQAAGGQLAGGEDDNWWQNVKLYGDEEDQTPAYGAASGGA